jgi:hypothetical protein
MHAGALPALAWYRQRVHSESRYRPENAGGSAPYSQRTGGERRYRRPEHVLNRLGDAVAVIAPMDGQ